VCDTLCVVGAGRTLFAKNSDRPPGEAQVVEWHPPRPAGGALRTQYLSLEDRGAVGVVGSRPTWLFGFEHGVNEHAVAIGNERLWTVDDPAAQPPALIGMDLVRLALERSLDADEALDALTGLLAAHGQGGSCDADHDDPYFSSFLLADPRGAWHVETSARTWAARRVDDGVAISNRISLRGDWTRASDDVAPGSDFDAWRDPDAPTGIADHRLVATRAAVATAAAAIGPRDIVATLRHHGGRPWGAPGSPDDDLEAPPVEVDAEWRGVTVCMHVRGLMATTSSMVAELAPGAPTRTWTCLGSPCASVYVPGFGAHVSPSLADAATWRRFARLRDRVDADGGALLDVRRVLGPVERDLWDEADALDGAGDAAHAAYAARAFAPVDDALTRLGV
jgi:secernin